MKEDEDTIRSLGLQGFNRLKRCRYGLMLYNPNDRFVGRALDLYGEFSEGEVELFRQIVKPGQVVLDVGANIGTHTLFFAHAVGSRGVVIAFEPQRLVFQTLCANMALNSITNVICRNNGVGEDSGILRVPALDPQKVQNFGGLSLRGQTEGEPVERISIDDLDLKRCHFMKIDVEGMEIPVVAGAKETILRYRPTLYVENDREEYSDDLIRLISSLRYRLYSHRPPLFNRDNVARNRDNVFSDIISENMLCLPEESPVRVPHLPPVEVS